GPGFSTTPRRLPGMPKAERGAAPSQAKNQELVVLGSQVLHIGCTGDATLDFGHWMLAEPNDRQAPIAPSKDAKDVGALSAVD
ncbi:unnamed protein product, partial [Symbiodinium necroappetens]